AGRDDRDVAPPVEPEPGRTVAAPAALDPREARVAVAGELGRGPAGIAGVPDHRGARADAVVQLPAEQAMDRDACELARQVPHGHVERGYRERDGAAHADPEAVVAQLEPAPAHLGRVLAGEERPEAAV